MSASVPDPRREPARALTPEADAEQRRAVGERLRRLRQLRGLTLAEVAPRVELSLSFLSMLERGAADVSLSRLSRLAAFYGIKPGELLLDDVPGAAVTVVGADEGTAVERGAGVTYRVLAQHDDGGQVIYARLEPGAAFDDVLAHAGHDYVWVIAGAVVLLFGEERRAVAAGRLAYYPATTPHTVRNEGGEPAEVVAFISRPYW